MLRKIIQYVRRPLDIFSNYLEESRCQRKYGMGVDEFKESCRPFEFCQGAKDAAASLQRSIEALEAKKEAAKSQSA